MPEVRTAWQTGQPIPAKDMRSNSEALSALLSSAQNFTEDTGQGGPSDARHVVKITAVTEVDGLFYYEFEQVSWDAASGEWVTAANGVTHSTIGKIVAQGRPDSTHAGIDDIVTIRPGVRVDNNRRRLWEFVPSGRQWYYAKVTASSSSVADITLAEVDSNGDVITGGRAPTDAKVPNERKGVPPDTFGIAFELPPTAADGDVVTKFMPWDGLTESPKDLASASGLTANTTTWSVEEDSSPVQADLTRYAFVEPTLGLFWREVICDASGMVTNISGETKYVIEASADQNSTSGHIALVAAATDGAFIVLNEPLTSLHDVVLIPGTGITINGSASAGVPIEFDNSGRALVAKNGEDLEITIAVTGGGGDADGQGYNEVQHNGVNVLTKADDGVLNFVDTSNSGTTLGVTFGVADNDPKAGITATVDLSENPPNEATELVFDGWIEIDPGAASQDVVLSNADWRGRVVRVNTFVRDGTFAAVNSANWGAGQISPIFVGVNDSSQRTIDSVSSTTLVIDGTDGGKLKLIGAFGTGGDIRHIRILARATSQRSASTIAVA